MLKEAVVADTPARSKAGSVEPIPGPNDPPHFLRQWRDSHGYTLDEMAEAINRLRGWKRTGSYLSRIEAGKLHYTQPILEAYATVLGCKPAELLSRRPANPDELWEKLTTAEKHRLLRMLDAV